MAKWNSNWNLRKFGEFTRDTERYLRFAAAAVDHATAKPRYKRVKSGTKRTSKKLYTRAKGKGAGPANRSYYETSRYPKRKNNGRLYVKATWGNTDLSGVINSFFEYGPVKTGLRWVRIVGEGDRYAGKYVRQASSSIRGRRRGTPVQENTTSYVSQQNSGSTGTKTAKAPQPEPESKSKVRKWFPFF